MSTFPLVVCRNSVGKLSISRSHATQSAPSAPHVSACSLESCLTTLPRLSSEFAVGEDSIALKENRVRDHQCSSLHSKTNRIINNVFILRLPSVYQVLGVQCLSGTGALRTAGEFIAKYSPCKTILSSDPTWGVELPFLVLASCGL